MCHVFEDSISEAKAKVTKICPRGLLEFEASLQGHHPIYLSTNQTLIISGLPDDRTAAAG